MRDASPRSLVVPLACVALWATLCCATVLPARVIRGQLSYESFERQVLRSPELEPVVLRLGHPDSPVPRVPDAEPGAKVLEGWRRAFGWTRLQLMQLCGDSEFEAWYYKLHGETWGGLAHGGPHNVRWFLEHMMGGQRCHNSSSPFSGSSKEVCEEIIIPRARTGEKLFLHEQAVCSLCPKLAQDFNLLSYWSTNHLHAVAPDPQCKISPMAESFPALSIAPNQTGVGLRQAHHGAATWLAVTHGTKRVRLYAPRDAHHLHASDCSSPGSTKFNMCKSVKVDAFDPDHAIFPRFSQLEAWETDLGPGDVLWIPSSWFFQACWRSPLPPSPLS